MSEKKDRKTKTIVFDSLLTLFKDKILTFETIKQTNLSSNDMQLVKTYFEQEVKLAYQKFVDQLQ